MLAIVLSVLAFDSYFLSSLHSLAANLSELPRIVIFTITSMIAGYLSASQKSTTELLRMACDELAAKVQESESVTKALQTQNVERERRETALQHAQARLGHVTLNTALGGPAASISQEVNQPMDPSRKL